MFQSGPNRKNTPTAVSGFLSRTVQIPQHLKQSVYIGLHKMDLYIKWIYLFIYSHHGHVCPKWAL